MSRSESIVLVLVAVAGLLQATSCAGDGRGPPSNRIIGGVEAEPGEFPFMVALEFFNVTEGRWSFQCGGTILDGQHVLTAAHCVTDKTTNLPLAPDSLRVKVGCHELPKCNSTHAVVRVMAHSKWNWQSIGSGNDIAVLKLGDEIDFGQSVGPNKIAAVTLAQADDSCCDNATETLTAIGWGFTVFPFVFPDNLMKVNISSYPLEECKKAWFKPKEQELGDDLVCTRTIGKNICDGDSGGPLFKTQSDGTPIQVGITSFGDGICSTENGSVFTKVAAFRTWIKQCTSYGGCSTL